MNAYTHQMHENSSVAAPGLNDPLPVIRVVIADDHPIMRQGTRALLEQAPDIEVVGEADNHNAVREVVAALRPDILLLDIQMPGPPAPETEAWVRQHYPGTETLVLTAHNRDDYLAEMLAAGARGFLLKDVDGHRLVIAIRRTIRGELLFTPQQFGRARQWEAIHTRWRSLTAREREVMQYAEQGQRNTEIAQTLRISARTIETHIRNAVRKLDVAGRGAALKWMREHHLVEK